jgi:hypothetical protein
VKNHGLFGMKLNSVFHCKPERVRDSR